MDIRQTTVDTVMAYGQALVINPQQM